MAFAGSTHEPSNSYTNSTTAKQCTTLDGRTLHGMAVLSGYNGFGAICKTREHLLRFALSGNAATVEENAALAFRTTQDLICKQTNELDVSGCSATLVLADSENLAISTAGDNVVIIFECGPYPGRRVFNPHHLDNIRESLYIRERCAGGSVLVCAVPGSMNAGVYHVSDEKFSEAPDTYNRTSLTRGLGNVWSKGVISSTPETVQFSMKSLRRKTILICTRSLYEHLGADVIEDVVDRNEVAEITNLLLSRVREKTNEPASLVVIDCDLFGTDLKKDQEINLPKHQVEGFFSSHKLNVEKKLNKRLRNVRRRKIRKTVFQNTPIIRTNVFQRVYKHGRRLPNYKQRRTQKCAPITSESCTQTEDGRDRRFNMKCRSIKLSVVSPIKSIDPLRVLQLVIPENWSRCYEFDMAHYHQYVLVPEEWGAFDNCEISVNFSGDAVECLPEAEKFDDLFLDLFWNGRGRNKATPSECESNDDQARPSTPGPTALDLAVQSISNVSPPRSAVLGSDEDRKSECLRRTSFTEENIACAVLEGMLYETGISDSIPVKEEDKAKNAELGRDQIIDKNVSVVQVPQDEKIGQDLPGEERDVQLSIEDLEEGEICDSLCVVTADGSIITEGFWGGSGSSKMQKVEEKHGKVEGLKAKPEKKWDKDRFVLEKAASVRHENVGSLGRKLEKSQGRKEGGTNVGHETHRPTFPSRSCPRNGENRREWNGRSSGKWEVRTDREITNTHPLERRKRYGGEWKNCKVGNRESELVDRNRSALIKRGNESESADVEHNFQKRRRIHEIEGKRDRLNMLVQDDKNHSKRSKADVETSRHVPIAMHKSGSRTVLDRIISDVLDRMVTSVEMFVNAAVAVKQPGQMSKSVCKVVPSSQTAGQTGKCHLKDLKSFVTGGSPDQTDEIEQVVLIVVKRLVRKIVIADLVAGVGRGCAYQSNERKFRQLAVGEQKSAKEMSVRPLDTDPRITIEANDVTKLSKCQVEDEHEDAARSAITMMLQELSNLELDAQNHQCGREHHLMEKVCEQGKSVCAEDTTNQVVEVVTSLLEAVEELNASNRVIGEELEGGIKVTAKAVGKNTECLNEILSEPNDSVVGNNEQMPEATGGFQIDDEVIGEIKAVLEELEDLHVCEDTHPALGPADSLFTQVEDDLGEEIRGSHAHSLVESVLDHLKTGVGAAEVIENKCPLRLKMSEPENGRGDDNSEVRQVISHMLHAVDSLLSSSAEIQTGPRTSDADCETHDTENLRPMDAVPTPRIMNMSGSSYPLTSNNYLPSCVNDNCVVRFNVPSICLNRFKSHK